MLRSDSVETINVTVGNCWLLVFIASLLTKKQFLFGTRAALFTFHCMFCFAAFRQIKQHTMYPFKSINCFYRSQIRFSSRSRIVFLFSLGLIDDTRSSASAAAYSRIRAWRSTSNSIPTNGVLSSSDEWMRDIRARFSLLHFMLTRWTWEEFQNDLAISQWIWIWFNNFLINHCPSCVSLGGRWKGRNAHIQRIIWHFSSLVQRITGR